LPTMGLSAAQQIAKLNIKIVRNNVIMRVIC
jgi:hypothetical protein